MAATSCFTSISQAMLGIIGPGFKFLASQPGLQRLWGETLHEAQDKLCLKNLLPVHRDGEQIYRDVYPPYISRHIYWIAALN
jgi:hypothetical protein